MKRIQISLIALISISSLAMAGGDIAPIKFYEEELNVESVVVEPAPIEVEAPMIEQAPMVEEIHTVKEAHVVKPAVEEEVAPIPVAVANVSGIYAGLGISAARYDTKCRCNSSKKSKVDKTAGIMARVGYDFNKYIGVEARGIISNQKGNDGEIKHAGVFVKPMLPVGDATNIYGLVGMAKTTTQGSLRRTDVTGLAFGAGIEYDLSDDKKKDAKYDRKFDGKGDQEKGLGLFADYERLYYKSGSPDLDAVNVGVTYDF